MTNGGGEIALRISREGVENAFFFNLIFNRFQYSKISKTFIFLFWTSEILCDRNFDRQRKKYGYEKLPLVSTGPLNLTTPERIIVDESKSKL